jgi:hypothetical protein
MCVEKLSRSRKMFFLLFCASSWLNFCLDIFVYGVFDLIVCFFSAFVEICDVDQLHNRLKTIKISRLLNDKIINLTEKNEIL